MVLKGFLAIDALAASIIGAINVNNTAGSVILAAGALTAAGVLWRSFLKPAGKIIARTVDAVEVLETLPTWRKELDKRHENHDERLADVEAEVAIVATNVAAVRRHLGIADDDVRQPPEPQPHRPR